MKGQKFDVHILIVTDDIIGIKERIKDALERIDGVEAVMVPEVSYRQERIK